MEKRKRDSDGLPHERRPVKQTKTNINYEELMNVTPKPIRFLGSDFNLLDQPCIYAALLSIVLLMPHIEQRNALPSSATSSSKEYF